MSLSRGRAGHPARGEKPLLWPGFGTFRAVLTTSRAVGAKFTQVEAGGTQGARDGLGGSDELCRASGGGWYVFSVFCDRSGHVLHFLETGYSPRGELGAPLNHVFCAFAKLGGEPGGSGQVWEFFFWSKTGNFWSVGLPDVPRPPSDQSCVESNT